MDVYDPYNNVYVNYIEKFIDKINDPRHFHFEMLYRSCYNLSCVRNMKEINKLYEKGRMKIVTFVYNAQQSYLNILNDVFMYPMRIGVIDEQSCVMCDKKVGHKSLYCDKHIVIKQVLESILKFKKFKVEGIPGSKLYYEAWFDFEKLRCQIKPKY